MTTREAMAGLESCGVGISLGDDGKILLAFPPGYKQSEREEKILATLKSAREEVVAFLHARSDERRGFTKAEPILESTTLQTRDIKQALLIGDAIAQGKAVLDGFVVYDLNERMVTLRYWPLVPPEWIDDPTNRSGSPNE